MTRRRAIRLSPLAALCLLLGAATTVGVAWGTSFPDRWSREMDRYSREWPRAVPQEWNWSESDVRSRRVYSYWWSEWGYQHCSAGLYHPGGEVDPLVRMEVRSFGWPCLALVTVRGGHEAGPASMDWQFVSVRQGFGRRKPFFSWPSEVQWLPVMPIWTGFAADTALYAGAWYLLIFVPLALYRTTRRRFRVSRGMCGSCGYDLKGSPGGACPECGGVT